MQRSVGGQHPSVLLQPAPPREIQLTTVQIGDSTARFGNDGDAGGAYWIFPFNGTPSCEKANYKDCQTNAIPVGATTGVSFGQIFDMGGNAWEWVGDWFRNTYYCDPENVGGYAIPNCNTAHVWQNPTGDPEGTAKVLRGGSWHHPVDMMRNAKREYLDPSISSNLAGFRCAGR